MPRAVLCKAVSIRAAEGSLLDVSTREGSRLPRALVAKCVFGVAT